MKILQYFLLLILLSAVSLVVFVLTQNPNFTVERQFVLQAPKNIVYQYIADLDKWSTWILIQKQDKGKYTLEIDNLGTYLIQPEYKYPSDSLTQDILKDDKISNIKWSFQSTNDSLATLVDFKFSSSLDLKTKLLTFFKGSPNSIAAQELEKNTNALMVYFIKQYQEHHFDSIARVNQPDLRYIALGQQESDYLNLDTDLTKSINTLMKFCKDNNLPSDQSPFLLVNKSDNKHISYQVALPINQEIFLNPDDIFISSVIPSGDYIVNNLQGHYTHLGPYLTNYKQVITKAQATLQPNEQVIIILENSVLQSPNPAKWKTTIKIPVEKILSEPQETTTTL